MRTPTSLLATWVLLGCRPTPEASAVASEVGSVVGPSSHAPSDPLPALPSDLRGALGEAADAVRSQLLRSKPTLTEPFATSAEHRAWVDRELEPWLQRARDVAALVSAAGPAEPGSRASADEWKAYDRAHFVQRVLWISSSADAWIVRTELPIPLDVQRDPEQDARVRESMAFILGDAMGNASTWKNACTWGGDARLPELEPWSRHCNNGVDALADSVCRAEPRLGLPPSAVCSGDRALGAPPPPTREGPAQGRARSVEEMAKLAEQVFLVCDLAEDVLADPELEPSARVRAWRDRFVSAGVDRPEISTLVDDALATREDAGSKVLTGLEGLLHSHAQCDALVRLFEEGP